MKVRVKVLVMNIEQSQIIIIIEIRINQEMIIKCSDIINVRIVIDIGKVLIHGKDLDRNVKDVGKIHWLIDKKNLSNLQMIK